MILRVDLLILIFQLLYPILHAIDVQFQLLFNADMLSYLSLQFLNDFFINLRRTISLRIAIHTILLA